MISAPSIMQLAQDAARHASARQGAFAQNIAHADTPGYRARTLPDFATWMRGVTAPRATRAGHLGGGAGAALQARAERNPATVKPNGNTVSLENEMMRAARARLDHETALSAYTSARTILRTSLGR